MNLKALLQNDISMEGSKEGEAGERRGVHAFKLHVLNHTALLKSLHPRQRDEDSVGEEWGDVPMSESLTVQGSGEEKRGNQSCC